MPGTWALDTRDSSLIQFVFLPDSPLLLIQQKRESGIIQLRQQEGIGLASYEVRLFFGWSLQGLHFLQGQDPKLHNVAS